MTVSHGTDRLGIGVIGAGRVGAVLGNALRAAGHALVGVSARSPESRDRAELLLPGVPVLGVPDIVERSELVLLAVPDDTLAPLVGDLARARAWQEGQLVVHTCGRHGIGVLAPARALGAVALAVHPAMTFTGTSLDLARLSGAPFAVTAPLGLLPIAQALVLEMGGEPFAVAEADRALYHAGLCHGANHLVTLVCQAASLLEAAGIADPARALRPLLGAALDNALASGPSALTGPVSRADTGTLRAHLTGIGEAAGRGEGRLDAVAETYRTLARATVDTARTAGRIDPQQAAAVLAALQAGPAAADANGRDGAGGVVGRERDRDGGRAGRPVDGTEGDTRR